MNPTVQTGFAAITGCESEFAHVYKGIPFAQPPIGDLRFHAPKKYIPKSKTMDAVSFSSICPQGGQQPGSMYQKEFYDNPDFMPAMSEDCLYLNIWTPKEITEPCPVAIWFHGGGFLNGFGSELEFDGDAYAKRGVILVTANYRLGIFGYFCHPELTAADGHSGNYGMLDQIAAIDWVREHISAFGGDPEQITIFGQSAGGMSVRTLISSPLVKGKVQRAILQSCGGYKGPLSLKLTTEKMETIWAKFLKKKHLTLNDLRALSADRLQKFGFEFMPFAILRTRTMLSMTPLIDGWALPDDTDELLLQEKTLPIPTMIGSTKNDIMIKKPGVKDREKNKIHTSSVEWCKIKNKQGAPAYAYYFSRQLPGDELGAFHSAELWYMFGTLSRCWRPMTEEDYALSERMLDAWVSFIKTGNPGWDACTEENPYVEEFC